MAIKSKPTISTWSYSRWKCWDQCPLKARFKFINKLVEPSSPALERGTQIHQMAQDFIEGKLKKLPAELKDFAKMIRKLKKIGATCELEWGFTKTWDPCAWMANDVWSRIKTDVIFTDSPGSRTVIDWKTGKIYDDNEEQMELYALATFLREPDCDRVITVLAYLDQNEAKERVFFRAGMDELRHEWERRVRPMLRDTIFPARPSHKCRWCHFRAANGGPCTF